MYSYWLMGEFLFFFFLSIRATLNVQLTNEEIKHGAQVIKQAAESIFGKSESVTESSCINTIDDNK